MSGSFETTFQKLADVFKARKLEPPKTPTSLDRIKPFITTWAGTTEISKSTGIAGGSLFKLLHRWLDDDIVEMRKVKQRAGRFKRQEWRMKAVDA